MGILERLFGGGRGRSQSDRTKQRLEVVPLADRTPVETFRVELVGISAVNHDGVSRQAAISRCAVGEETVLMREPRPRGYPASIAVWSTGAGEQLGSLPLESSTYVLLHARRYDFRSTVQDMPEQDDGNTGVILRIEAFEKRG